MITMLRNSDHIYVGMGAKDPNDDTSVVPVATFVAHPNMTYVIWPHVVYYISTGDYAAGQIIDVAALGVTQEVDFTGATINDVTYIHNANGEYVRVN
jgi:hypothetical protein